MNLSCSVHELLLQSAVCHCHKELFVVNSFDIHGAKVQIIAILRRFYNIKLNAFRRT